MARRVSALVLLGILVAVTASLVVAAAPTVTLVLRSGEKVRGELIDLGGVGYTVRVGGSERRIAAGDVAVIDFTGAPFRPAELERVRQGQAIAVFHSGDVFEGRLVDIGGTDPLRMTFSTSGGNRDVNSSELSRVYLSRWQGMPEGSGATTLPGEAPGLAQGGEGMTIPANPCWTNTARSVRQGQRVTFSGSGEIQLSADRNDIASVAGSRTGRTSSNAPIPGALAGALIGRVGNSRPCGIGDQKTALPMPASGQLWLGINDDSCGDNRGQFKVQISIGR
jgi:hypothetical protein